MVKLLSNLLIEKTFYFSQPKMKEEKRSKKESFSENQKRQFKLTVRQNRFAKNFYATTIDNK